MIRNAIVALGTAAAALSAYSASPHGGTASLALQIEAGYFTHMVNISPTTLELPPLPANLAALVTENPALPAPLRTIAKLSENHNVQVLPAAEGVIKVCITTPALRQSAWSNVYHQMNTVGWVTSRTNDCSQASAGTGLPTGDTARLTFFRYLDRDDVPLRTKIAGFPHIELPDDARLDAKTLPAIVIHRKEGDTSPAVSIVIENPKDAPDPALLLNPNTVALYQQQWDEATIKLTNVSIRSPFEAEHTCSKLGPKQFCTISVSFLGGGLKAGAAIPGSLFFDFDNANPSRIGFEGRVVR